MSTVLLIKIAGILGVGAIIGFSTYSQAKKSEQTAKYAKLVGVLAAIIGTFAYVAIKFYLGSL